MTRAGVKLACQSSDDLDCVGEVDTIDEAIDATPQFRPDVAIIDPGACGTNPIEGLIRYRNRFADQSILVFTSNDSPNLAAELVKCGVAGYLIKDASADELTWAIRSIHDGRVFFSHKHHGVGSPKKDHAKIDVVANAAASSDATISAAATWSNDAEQSAADIDLSTREREVLTLIADGMTNKQAASELFLSVKTVETYRSRVMRKHQLKDRHELVRFARHHSPVRQG
ncbi:Oxygen regulatory protein NreC [Rubripirellula tenax]|uniref:Oxygen regulatory protein NreC n=2 Tax=Rubripirellula tenax TaxID=2528015 RepID=A0A5C6FF67_9BACT|nr:Oxygen regulatory protein NreC [Rubripirellula tenax]